jgi:hypothetical protein
MTITVELSIEQIVDVLKKLTPAQRLALIRLLTTEDSFKQETTTLESLNEVLEELPVYEEPRMDLDRQIAKAAEALVPYYSDDKALTAFTAIDADDFYGEG